jgi:P pilus assembly chaperone PapD
VAPPGAGAKPELQWRVARDGAAGVTLSATNAGTAHIHLQGISLHPPGGEAVVAKVSSYLLPGQSRQWRIAGTALANAPRFQLTARSDAGDLSEQLVPGR